MGRTAKEYLKQYEELNKRAQRLKAEYETEQLQIDAIGSTLSGDGLPHGTGVSRKTEDKAIRLADKAMAWKMAELDALAKRQEVFELINGIEGKPGEVLYERYVNLHKWEHICVLLNISSVSRWKEFGYDSPEAAAQDWNNLQAAHWCCNQAKSNKIGFGLDKKIKLIMSEPLIRDGDW